MNMSYTKNPYLPRVRMQTARLVLAQGWTIRKAARYVGVEPSTVMRWVKKAELLNQSHTIPTLSSRPHHHPKTLDGELVSKIIEYRLKYRRCAEIIHRYMLRDGYDLSLASVKRTLKRNGMTKYSKWKKWHRYPERPIASFPGELVELDTIVDGEIGDRLYIYTLLDVASRWADAKPVVRINTHQSVRFVSEVKPPFRIKLIQSDHGSEFSRHFSRTINTNGIEHRHTRVRQPTDNGHLERFNRTIQEECLNRIPRDLKIYQKEIAEYLKYYNEERMHMGINYQTPAEVLRSY